MESSRSEGTRRTYATGWCKREAHVALPAHPVTVAAYLVDAAEGFVTQGTRNGADGSAIARQNRSIGCHSSAATVVDGHPRRVVRILGCTPNDLIEIDVVNTAIKKTSNGGTGEHPAPQRARRTTIRRPETTSADGRESSHARSCSSEPPITSEAMFPTSATATQWNSSPTR